MPDCMPRLDASGLARRRAGRVRATGRSSASASACRCCSTRARRARRAGLGVLPRPRRALSRRGDDVAVGRAPQGAAHGLEPGAAGAAASAVGGHRRRQRASILRTAIIRVPDEPAVTAGTADYPAPFTCAIARANIFATQFHPEKSHRAGLAAARQLRRLGRAQLTVRIAARAPPRGASPRAVRRTPSAAMQIIPAIDIKDGHCVRLKQGEMHSATVFSEDPAAMAQHWLEQGAERLHLVDLNGAVAGVPKNELAIREIVSVIGEEIPVQLGGGIRDLDTIERYLDDGITLRHHRHGGGEEPGFLHDACYAFPGHIIVGLDARDGKVATDGWSKMTGPRRRRPREEVRGLRRRGDHLHRHRPRRHADRRQRRGARCKLARELKIPVIASGGIASIDDIERAAAVRERRHHRRDRRARALRGQARLQGGAEGGQGRDAATLRRARPRPARRMRR